YDPMGNLLSKRIEHEGQLQFQEKYAYDEAGNHTETITSHGTFKTLYNTLGKPLSEKDPLGFVTTHEYLFGNGYRESTTDANQIQTLRLYDNRGRVSELLKKNLLGEILAKETSRYDKNGNLIESTHTVFQGTEPIRTVTHNWEYGPMGRLERFIEAGEKETRYLYDARGRLNTVIKPSGTQLHHEWDDLGRLARYFASDFDYRYTYDSNDRILSVYDAISKKKTTRTYNALGNTTQETLGNGLKLTNTFDGQGRRIALILPDNTTIDYTYQGAYLYRVSRNGLKYTYAERDIEGYIIQADLPKHIGHLSIKRDGLSRWSKCDSPFYAAKYEYDPVGNLLRHHYQDALGKEDALYQYDDLNQLILENEHTYLCDSLNNRLKKDDLPHQINNLNQVIHDGETAYEYDRDGNLIFDGFWRYTYDTQDRLIALENAGVKIEYTYDPFHRRLSKRILLNGRQMSEERYLWDGDNEIGVVTEKGIEELRILGEGVGAEIG
ncbi:MAG: RHS repeat protein, partial [Chlamydiia bacterium]|nr:RHS repeat protein [Chlamydiia bacterium]